MKSHGISLVTGDSQNNENLMYITVGTTLGSWHDHVSLFRLTSWSWSKLFSSDKKQNIPASWYLNLLSNRCVRIRRLSFVISHMNWPLRITYDFYRSSSCTILLILCPETSYFLAVALIYFLRFLFIIFCAFCTNLVIPMILGSLTGSYCRIFVQLWAIFDNKQPCNIPEGNHL